MTDDIFQLDMSIEEIAAAPKVRMPSDGDILNVSEMFKILSDPTRLRVLYALAASEMCVQDISSLAGVSQSAVSHQLRILRNSRLVCYRKSGKQVFYSLDSESTRGLIQKAMEHTLG